MILMSITTAVAILAANTAAKFWYAGVTESGGEFRVYSSIVALELPFLTVSE
jgi:hypothetical protein